MTWVLVLLLIHADGSFTEVKKSRPTEEACHRLGRAILAQVNTRDSDVASFTCELKK